MDDIQTHTSNIRMTYEYMRVTYGWHTNTYDRHTNDIRNIKLYNRFGAFRLLFLAICVKNTALCWAKDFWSLGCFYSHTFY